MHKFKLLACSLSLSIGFLSPLSQASGSNTSQIQPDGANALLTPSTQNLDVDLASGAATTSIPIEVPPGRVGMAPKLALQYNSFNKEGLAGIGWSIGGVSVIERASNKGVPNYDNSTDHFFITQSGPRAELARVGSGSQYKARIEGEFQKIEFINNAYWVVTDRKGTKSYYGQTWDSIVQDPDDSSRIFRYLLERVEDINGNYMTFTYTPGLTEAEDRYPLEINYTGNGSTTAPYAKVKFNYNDNRTDTRFSYMAGFKIRHSKILASIETFVTNNQLQKRYELTYTIDPGSNQSFLTKVKHFGADGVTALPETTFEYSQFSAADLDFEPAINIPADRHPPVAFEAGTVQLMDMNGDGAVDMVYGPADGSAWKIYSSDRTGGFSTAQPVQNSPPYPMATWIEPNRLLRVADFNGDGLMDITYFSEPQKFWMNNGQQGFYPPENNTQAGSLSQWAKSVKHFDINGDGMVDQIFSIGPSSSQPLLWLKQLNNGSGQFTSNWTEISPSIDNRPFVGAGSDGIRYFDFNGDGSLDALHFKKNEQQIWLNNANGGFKPPVLSPNAAIWEHQFNNFVDMNGDGLIEWIETVPPWNVHYNLGNSQFSAGQPPLNPSPQFNGFFIFCDINGDGLQDIFRSTYIYPDYIWQVLINDNGNGFLPPVNITQHHPTETFYKEPIYKINLAFADINGDGRMDMIYGGLDYNQAGNPVVYQIWLGKKDSRASRSGLLVKINSPGRQTEIMYGASPIKGLLGPQYGWACQSMLFSTVSKKKITTANGTYETNFKYEGGLWNAKEREFRGFAKVTQTDPDGNITETKFGQDDLLKGRILEQSTSSPTGQLYEKTVNAWDHQNINPGIDFVFLQQTDHFTYDGGSNARRTQEKFIYGETPQFGNVTQHIELGEVNATTGADTGSDKRSTETTYGNNNSNGLYLIGFPQYVVRKDNAGTIMQQSWFFYDNLSNYLTLPTKGLLRRVKEWGGWGESDIQTTMTYDAFGNVILLVDPRNSPTNIQYDPLGVFPLRIKNALQMEEFSAYYGVNGVPLSDNGYQGLFGQVQSTTDFNNQQTKYSYDALGRSIKEVGPLDTLALPSTEISYTPNSTHWLVQTKKRINHGQAPTLDSYQFYDGLDRLIQTKTPMETAGTYSVTGQTTYNHRGSPLQSYLPFSSNAATTLETIDTNRYHTQNIYDPLYRIKEQTNADGTYRSFYYDHWMARVIDENGHRKDTYYDAYGRPIIRDDFTDADGRSSFYPATPPATSPYATTNYYYDALDNLTNITDAQGNYLFNLYDGLGRKVLMRDPSMMGEDRWRYDYDAGGNLIYQADPKGQEIILTYDQINRLTTKKDVATNGSVYNVNYFYDDPTVQYSKGRLTKTMYQNNGAGQVLYSYDALGRVVDSIRRIDGADYTIHKAYDALSRSTSIIYPDSRDVRYTYNTSGAIETVYDTFGQTYVSNVNYDAAGQITQIDTGNSKSTVYTYKPETLQVLQKTTAGVQDLKYDYDTLGQVRKITSLAPSAPLQTYQYDELNRLKFAHGRYGNRNYQYDQIGNITLKDGLTYTYTQYSPGTGENVHSPASLSDGTTFAYDQNSNLIARTKAGVTTDYTYDIDNNLTQVKLSGSTQAIYTYDAEGNRTKKASFVTGNPVPPVFPNTVYYVDGLYEGGTNQVDHIFLGDQKIASVRNGQVEYYVTDHLGGTAFLTNAAGAVVETVEYDPFGKTTYYQHPGTNNELSWTYFTGQQFDGEAGLYYYGARHYDPVLGRFLQADSIVSDPLNPQTLNRHAYTLNNPINRIDPTGNESTDLDPIIIDHVKEDHSSGDAGNAASNNGGGGTKASVDVGAGSGGQGMSNAGSDSFSGSGGGFEGVHSFLGTAGLLPPPAGNVASGLDAGMYLGQGQYGQASLAGLGMIPFAGLATKMGKIGKEGQELLKLGNNFADKILQNSGRAGKQARLRALLNDNTVSKADKGWIKQEINSINRGTRTSIRVPPTKELAHRRGMEASKGYSYEHSDLQDKDLHRLQHKHEGY